MKNIPVFGEYIKKLRLDREITLRRFAAAIGVSPEYECNMEKGRRPAPTPEILQKIIHVLLLNKEETEQLYDLAAQSKNAVNTVPEDLTGFINENRMVVAALRMAKDVDATDKEWQEFMEKLRKRKDTSKED